MGRDITDVAASVRQRLLNIARSSNRHFNAVLQHFAMERFLYRLGRGAARCVTGTGVGRDRGGFGLRCAVVAVGALGAADLGVGVPGWVMMTERDRIEEELEREEARLADLSREREQVRARVEQL